MKSFTRLQNILHFDLPNMLIQICRFINRIKICMETGCTVVLLDLENLYASLYDVLNQYYSHYGDNKYVDLGLKTHKVRCRVADNFR